MTSLDLNTTDWILILVGIVSFVVFSWIVIEKRD